MPSPVKRLSRVEQQEQTRLALLDAAIELFIDQGIEGTSIEEVAAHAGFSRGAFYSNFSSKDDLVLDASRRFLEQLHAAARPPDGTTTASVGAAYRARLERMQTIVRGGASVFLAEFTLYAIRHPQVQETAAQLHQQQLEPAVEFVRAQLEAAGVSKSPVPLDVLANIIQASTFALDFVGRVDPEVRPDETLRTAMDLLFAGLATGGRKRTR